MVRNAKEPELIDGWGGKTCINIGVFCLRPLSAYLTSINHNCLGTLKGRKLHQRLQARDRPDISDEMLQDV